MNVGQGIRKLAVVLGLLLVATFKCRSDNGWEGASVGVTWENDAIATTDRHYTQGARVAYLSRDDGMPGFLKAVARFLPSVGYECQAGKWGLALSQDIYTPENLKAHEVVIDDRPYAGWLYGTFSLRKRGPTRHGLSVMETFGLDLGVIGRESLAEQAQKEWHSAGPNGWDNQLSTEIGANLRYERAYLMPLMPRGEPWEMHLIPTLSLSAGNVDTSARLAFTLRAGHNVPDEFEVPQEKTA